jgi:hypothetical protein
MSSAEQTDSIFVPLGDDLPLNPDPPPDEPPRGILMPFPARLDNVVAAAGFVVAARGEPSRTIGRIAGRDRP